MRRYLQHLYLFLYVEAFTNCPFLASNDTGVLPLICVPMFCVHQKMPRIRRCFWCGSKGHRIERCSMQAGAEIRKLQELVRTQQTGEMLQMQPSNDTSRLQEWQKRAQCWMLCFGFWKFTQRGARRYQVDQIGRNLPP